MLMMIGKFRTKFRAQTHQKSRSHVRLLITLILKKKIYSTLSNLIIRREYKAGMNRRILHEKNCKMIKVLRTLKMIKYHENFSKQETGSYIRTIRYNTSCCNSLKKLDVERKTQPFSFIRNGLVISGV